MSLQSELLTALVSGMETAFNAALKLDPDTQKHLASLSGKVIAMELRGFDLTLYLLPAENGLNMMLNYQGEADTTLSGTPLSLAEMSLGPDASRALFSGDVVIRGDVETGQKFKRILDQLDIDWEEQLSRLSGDIIAHKSGDFIRAAGHWGSQTLGALGNNLAEYLQMESQNLPLAEDVKHFMQDVDTLRDDVDRLEARIKRLIKSQASQQG